MSGEQGPGLQRIFFQQKVTGIITGALYDRIDFPDYAFDAGDSAGKLGGCRIGEEESPQKHHSGCGLFSRNFFVIRWDTYAGSDW